MALACGAAFASGRVGGSAGPRTGTVGAARETSRPSPYSGLGTWVDVYDWSREFSGGRPVVGPADVDAMVNRFKERATAVRSRGMPPLEGADRRRFLERMKLDYQDFAMLGDATGAIEDGVLVLRVDLRPPDAGS